MTIDSQPDFIPLPWRRFLKQSHRTFPEQLVGFGIFLLIHSAFELINGSLIVPSFQSTWFRSLIQAPWALADQSYILSWTAYSFTLSLSIWTLWRRYSLRVLKLEFSVFFSQILFQLAWSISFFVLQEPLLALMALLLLWCNNLLAAVLFWKKERISGQLLLIPFIWIFYVMALNMIICISNP